MIPKEKAQKPLPLPLFSQARGCRKSSGGDPRQPRENCNLGDLEVSTTCQAHVRTWRESAWDWSETLVTFLFSTWKNLKFTFSVHDRSDLQCLVGVTGCVFTCTWMYLCIYLAGSFLLLLEKLITFGADSLCSRRALLGSRVVGRSIQGVSGEPRLVPEGELQFPSHIPIG